MDFEKAIGYVEGNKAKVTYERSEWVVTTKFGRYEIITSSEDFCDAVEANQVQTQWLQKMADDLKAAQEKRARELQKGPSKN